MKQEEKDKIKREIVDARNLYAHERACNAAEEHGKIAGADYILSQFLKYLDDESLKETEIMIPLSVVRDIKNKIAKTCTEATDKRNRGLLEALSIIDDSVIDYAEANVCRKNEAMWKLFMNAYLEGEE